MAGLFLDAQVTVLDVTYSTSYIHLRMGSAARLVLTPQEARDLAQSLTRSADEFDAREAPVQQEIA